MNTIQRAPSSNTYRMMPNSTRDTEIQSLMKQKSLLNEKIAEVKSNQELDNKIKTERLKSLTTELQMIDAQITQKQLEQEEKRKSDSASNQPTSNQTKTGTSMTTDPSIDHLLTAHTLYNNLGKVTSVRSKLNREATTIHSEVKQDRLKHEDDGAGDPGKASMRENAERTVIKKKNEQGAAVQAKIFAVDEKIGSSINEINQAVKGNEGNPTTDELINDKPQDRQQDALRSTHQAIDVRL